MSKIAMIGGAAALGLSLLASNVLADENYDDLLLHSVGEFAVANGDSKIVAMHKTDHDYRICVRNSEHGVPLKVMHDDRTSLVYPGDCADFEAKEISVAPDGKLPSDTLMIGRYERLSGGDDS
jgi:hypothetical protein